MQINFVFLIRNSFKNYCYKFCFCNINCYIFDSCKITSALVDRKIPQSESLNWQCFCKITTPVLHINIVSHFQNFTFTHTHIYKGRWLSYACVPRNPICGFFSQPEIYIKYKGTFGVIRRKIFLSLFCDAEPINLNLSSPE